MTLQNKQIIKKAVVIGLFLNLIFTTVSPVKEFITYGMFLRDFKMVGKIRSSTHVTVQNDSVEEVEKEYIKVRQLLNLGHINDKVIVIKADANEFGIIGTCDGDEVYGVYNNNIIVYNGEQSTLQHELAHFFFDKLRDSQQSESFAQSIEGIFYLLRARK